MAKDYQKIFGVDNGQGKVAQYQCGAAACERTRFMVGEFRGECGVGDKREKQIIFPSGSNNQETIPRVFSCCADNITEERGELVCSNKTRG